MPRTWHLCLALVVGAALVLQFVLLLSGGQDVNSVESSAQVDMATRLLRFFSYFTVQSNLLVLASAASLAMDPQRDGRVWRVLRLDALVGIASTGVIFATLLAPLLELEGAAALANAGLHYVSPVATVLIWLACGPRGRIDMRTVVLAFAWPVAWLGYTLVHGALSGWYPYPFLNVTRLGMGQVLANTAMILLAAVVLALVFKALDGVLSRRAWQAST